MNRIRMPLVAMLLAGALVATGPGASPAGATTDREERLFGLINRERAARGLPRLRLNQNLSKLARNHSRSMASNGRVLYHSCLSCKLRTWRWNIAGENVGAARSAGRVHRLLMHSRSHRDNIIRKGFKRVGVGAVRRGGLLWVTQIFLG